ncbi:MAG: ABC transporter substrate-binding protein [Firmicutes bacterium]|nr:ABC transporter substrate-binding protein [Bacillota bacterium]
MKPHIKLCFIGILALSIILLGTTAGLAYNEAPMLSKLVKEGKLPPVEKRLPVKEDIMVVTPVEEIGQYGGTWRAVHWDPGMGNLKMIMYDPPVRWNRDYTAYVPGLAKKWEFSKDGKTITFYFRKGVKWSDGHPFTTEDLKFWWEDLALNEDYQVIRPPWWAYKNGKLMKVNFIDDYTVSFTFDAPNWNVPYVLASGFWEWEPLMKPKHYLKQFHPKYNPKIKDWKTFQDKDQWWQNPEYPTLFAWHCVKYVPGERVIFERNPYYWKVDTKGNQLPYIDRIESVEVTDPEVRLLQVLKGDYTATFRGVDNPRNIPVLLERQEAGGYRVILWQNGAGGWPGILVNQNYVGDKWMRDLLRNQKFRAALSLAIDRNRVNEVIWNGMATPRQGTISKESWHFRSPEGQKVYKEWANNYAKYDPKEANRLLDSIGLTKRDAQGFRTRPDGSKLELVLDITGWGIAEINAETGALVKNFWEAVGLRTVLNAVQGTPEEGQRQTQSTYQFRFAHCAEMDLWTYPDWVFPVRDSRAWPKVGRWYMTGGEEGEAPEPGSPEEKLIKLYEKGIEEPNVEKRHRYVWDAIKIHITDGPFYIGITGDLPQPVIVKKNFRNVPDFGILGPWAVGGPGNTNPEQYFIKQ